MNRIIFESSDARKSLVGPDGAAEILKGVNLKVEAGESVAIVGASGSGKSSFLLVAAGLSRLSGGRVVVNGKDMASFSESRLCAFRNENIGFVFQSHRLLPELSAEENVAMPLLIRRASREEALSRAREALSSVGMERRLRHRSSEMSGGERQRVAVARALAGNPRLVLADEPTGSLDSENAALVEECLFAAAKKKGASLILVTHDETLAGRADRTEYMKDGRILERVLNISPRIPLASPTGSRANL